MRSTTKEACLILMWPVFRLQTQPMPRIYATSGGREFLLSPILPLPARVTAQPTGGYSTFGFPSNPTNFVTYFLDTSRDFGTTARPATYSTRSEEHTSELQSPCNLVCRLLLEK